MNIEEHLLVCLTEEGLEVGQDASKSLRFGLDDVNALKPDGPTNRGRLIMELNDFFAVVELLEEEGILHSQWQDKQAQAAKKLRVREWMKHAEKVGALQREAVV